jgi:uncharacterized protein YdeI (YjbR/CyaY-like superfamily)
MILESFDRQTLVKMEIALEQACSVVSTGSQKHMTVVISRSKLSNARRAAIETSVA